jgi:dTDP-4-amino-4,6-dideoxygalactose transaminase
VTRHLALDGGAPAFPDGLPLVQPSFDDLPGVMSSIQSVLESGQLTNGRNVAELEERVAARMHVDHVVAVGSCTAGLMLVYQGLGVRGDVVMPSHTFSASAHAVRWAGGAPRFADVERSRATLDPEDVRRRVDGAAALSATHLYGHPAEVDALEAIAQEAGIPLVFDSAHALGSVHSGRAIGTFGHAEVFSMSPTKVTVAGEGGLVATDDPDLAAHVRIGRNYGNPGDYNCAFPGLNARMSELHAVLGLASLAGLDDRLESRLRSVDAFERVVATSAALRVVRPADGDVSTFKDLTFELAVGSVGATWLQRALAAEGVDSRRYFWPPVHQQDAYQGFARDNDLPVTDDLAGRLLTVPLTTRSPVETTERLAEVVVSLVEAGSLRRAS